MQNETSDNHDAVVVDVVGPTELEIIESVDMNRVLESGGNIKMIPTELFTLGIDTIEELKYSERLMKDDQTLKRYLF